jgi:DNA replication licensing factor MCM4
MRQLGNSKKIITATPRQLESLIRLSEAFAKMRLSSEVNVSDVEEAINLIKVATQQAATDPSTGLIDMDILTTGRTAAVKMRITKIA